MTGVEASEPTVEDQLRGIRVPVQLVSEDAGPGARRFVARAWIAEMMQFGGARVARELAVLDRRSLEDVALEALGVFAALDDRPGAACQFWRRYAETGEAR